MSQSLGALGQKVAISQNAYPGLGRNQTVCMPGTIIHRLHSATAWNSLQTTPLPHPSGNPSSFAGLVEARANNPSTLRRPSSRATCQPRSCHVRIREGTPASRFQDDRPDEGHKPKARPIQSQSTPRTSECKPPSPESRTERTAPKKKKKRPGTLNE